MPRRALEIAVLLLAAGSPSWAKVDLTTLPPRGRIQLTIYNSADITLVREVRSLTLQEGMNRLEFGWARTAVDPTSLNLVSPEHPGAVELVDVAFPPRTTQTSVWTIRSTVAGEVPVEISYFTSGLSWEATYEATLAPDQTSMDLASYLRVTNRSGEDYPDAEVRVVVGRIHTVDEIAELAARPHPYGTPLPTPEPPGSTAGVEFGRALDRAERAYRRASESGEAKAIVKEGLSEYFLYTIEGTETIPDGWSKRLPSLHAEDIPVVNLYRHERERFGEGVHRFLLFANDKEHHLGETPLPDGQVMVYRRADDEAHLGFVGRAPTRYIPVDQKVELDLGVDQAVLVTATLMDLKTENHSFDGHGDLNGYDDVQQVVLRLRNLQELAARVEVTLNLPHAYWDLSSEAEGAGYERWDVDTVRFTVELAPGLERKLPFVLRLYEGVRRERR
ncbi:MAG: DUF4139 domain-containing protein [Planctomycetes bacterium]|nr:DUF4139 domain-containing protein [Planctomycetota bacterium]